MANAGTLIPVKSSGCGPLAQGFYKQGRLEGASKVRKYDIVFMCWDFDEDSGYVPYASVDHVVFAISDPDSNGNFKTIEGNTGYTDSSNMYGEVAYRTRNIEDVSCTAHPKYTSQITGAMVMATMKKQIGIKATPVKVCKFNTWYYGYQASGDWCDWCATFQCWCFYATTYSDVKKAFLNVKLQLFSDECVARVGVVKNVQRILKCCGYDIDVTGVQDAKTKAAIKKYQKKFGLNVTGNLNPETALSIFSLEKV